MCSSTALFMEGRLVGSDPPMFLPPHVRMIMYLRIFKPYYHSYQFYYSYNINCSLKISFS